MEGKHCQKRVSQEDGIRPPSYTEPGPKWKRAPIFLPRKHPKIAVLPPLLPTTTNRSNCSASHLHSAGPPNRSRHISLPRIGMTTPNPPADSPARRAGATGRGEPAQGSHRRRGRVSVQGGKEADGRKRTAAPGRGDVHGSGGEGRQNSRERAGLQPDSHLVHRVYPKHPGMPLVRPPGRHGPDDPAGWELSSSSLSPSTCSFSGTHRKRDPRLASGIPGWSLL